MQFKAGSMVVVSLALAIMRTAVFPGAAFSQTPFYQNKTITIVRGGEPGGSGDMQARALIPFLKKYIPGNPTIVIENMPGAAGMKAVNHIYRRLSPTASRSPPSARGSLRERSSVCRVQDMISTS